jgi:hypothetical protein
MLRLRFEATYITRVQSGGGCLRCFCTQTARGKGLKHVEERFTKDGGWAHTGSNVSNGNMFY